jgi:hypothetical protein
VSKTADAPPAPAPLPAQLWRWWRLRSRRGLVVVGNLRSAEAVRFAEQVLAGEVFPVPMDAERAEDADVVIIIGKISPKLSLPLAGLRHRLPPGAVVIAFDDDAAGAYASVRADSVVDVDIVANALPPSPALIEAVVRRLIPGER